MFLIHFVTSTHEVWDRPKQVGDHDGNLMPRLSSCGAQWFVCPCCTKQHIIEWGLYKRCYRIRKGKSKRNMAPMRPMWATSKHLGLFAHNPPFTSNPPTPEGETRRVRVVFCNCAYQAVLMFTVQVVHTCTVTYVRRQKSTINPSTIHVKLHVHNTNEGTKLYYLLYKILCT